MDGGTRLFPAGKFISVLYSMLHSRAKTMPHRT